MGRLLDLLDATRQSEAKSTTYDKNDINDKSQLVPVAEAFSPRPKYTTKVPIPGSTTHDISDAPPFCRKDPPTLVGPEMPVSGSQPDFCRLSRLCRTSQALSASFDALERRCPDHIEVADWQRVVEDGRRFLIQWGEQATALGWTEPDVFGLPPVRRNPRPMWRRLARVEQLGLVWLTHGRPVTSITAEIATIATPSGGSVSFYRLQACRDPKPDGRTP